VSLDVLLIPLTGGHDDAHRRAAVRRALENSGISLNHRGFASIDTKDGGQAEIDLAEDGEEFGAGFSLYALSLELSRIVYALAKAGDAAVVPASEPPMTLLVDAAHEARLPDEDLGAIKVAETPEALQAALVPAFRAFSEYRASLLEE
jgi:hypothetical protein